MNPSPDLQRPYPSLPLEIIFNVLDQLVDETNRQPAFNSSITVTKTLRALALVSRRIYPVASRYLYTHCLSFRDSVSFACFRRTLGLDLGNHPQALACGQSGRNDRLWYDAEIPKYITSVCIAPQENPKSSQSAPMVLLTQIIDTCNTIGHTLKTLFLDPPKPTYESFSEFDHLRSYGRENNIFLQMPNLEALVASYEVLHYFPIPPPKLKRLALIADVFDDVVMPFCFATSTLETLVVLRPEGLTAADIDCLFSAYHGKSLDTILVDVNSNHRTPTATRNWNDQDKVRIWEVDVPTSFYGDDENETLCRNWIWSHAFKGTLWSQDRRRMASWSEIQRRLAGPVHHF